MYEYVTLGPSPTEEKCVQVKRPDYKKRGGIECRLWEKVLIEKFGEPPFPTKLIIIAQQHEIGEYFEVICYYDTEDKTGSE